MLAYLPAAAGSVTACTMSVESASRTLVRNSFFLAPGHPKNKQRRSDVVDNNFTVLNFYHSFTISMPIYACHYIQRVVRCAVKLGKSVKITDVV